jgi:PAP2 superfamily protein
VSRSSAVQHGIDGGVRSWALSNVYLAAQLAVLPGALIWLYRRAPEVYRHLRNTILATWLIAIPIFAAYPVAPPRLADAHMVDTVSRRAAVALTGHSTVFYNPLAAVPSLHVGFAFAIAVAVAASLRSWWVRPLPLLWGPLVTVAVIATGNHFVFDAVAGLAVTALGFGAGELAAARSSASQEKSAATRRAVGRGSRASAPALGCSPSASTTSLDHRNPVTTAHLPRGECEHVLNDQVPS